MSKATPRPWSLGENANGSPLILGANLRGICPVISSHGLNERQANAELIVRAVNCHDELVEACEFALMQTDERRMPIQFKKLNDALKRARGSND